MSKNRFLCLTVIVVAAVSFYGEARAVAVIGAPVITRPGGSDPTLSVALGDPINYTLAATGTAPLTYSFGTLPGGVTATANKLTGIPNPAGTYKVPVTVSNAKGSDSATLTITVTGSALAGTIKIKDTYKDALKSFSDGGGGGSRFVDQVAFSTFSLQATIDPTGTPIDFKSDTEFTVSMGALSFTSTLGKAQKFAEGKSASFLYQIDIGDAHPKLITIFGVKISNSDKKLVITASGKGTDLVDGTLNLVITPAILAAKAPISLNAPCSIRFGSAAAIFNVKVTGDAPVTTTKNVGKGDNADTFTLLSATATGEGTATK